MLSSEDKIDLANVPPPIQIRICSQEQILQLFNQFGFKYEYQWLRQREFSIISQIYAIQFDTNNMVNGISQILIRLCYGELILQPFVYF